MNYSGAITKSALQEKLVALYLRLNGYLTTGLIIHSSNDTQVGSEIDIIGVRFCGHIQPDRIITCSEALEIPDNSEIDIIIGEVKGGATPLQFNPSLRHHPDRLRKVFKWIGAFREDDIDDLINEFIDEITPQQVQSPKPFSIIRRNSITIRPIIFAPDRPAPKDNQIKFIHGSKLIQYCWACFRPENARPECATNYRAVSNWGEQFERLVGFFKDYERQEPGNINELYEHFQVGN